MCDGPSSVQSETDQVNVDDRTLHELYASCPPNIPGILAKTNIALLVMAIC